MAIRPGRKSSSKNPPILSHEFVIQNHADIVSCFALIFVVGLMVQATSPLASVFIALQHSLSGTEPSAENPRGETFSYEAGWKDLCAIFFYSLICIIMHAILQEYLLDKVAKKSQQLKQSKTRTYILNESGQLGAFSLISAVWGLDVVWRERLWTESWKGYPDHPMSFMLKLYYIIQIAYYIHLLPEIYFQRIDEADKRKAIFKRSFLGVFLIGAAYYFKFHQLGMFLMAMHYVCDVFVKIMNLMEIFNKKNILFQLFHDYYFVFTRFAIMVVGVLGLFYGINTVPSLVMLLLVYALQGQMFVTFIKEYFEKRRLRKDVKPKKDNKAKKKPAPAKESDLPEADQDSSKAKKA